MAGKSVLDRLCQEVIDKGLCAACGACVGRCPYLIKFKGKTIRLDSCTAEQGQCHAYCPMTSFDPDAAAGALFGVPYDHSGLGNMIGVAATRSASSQLAASGQGGGTVTTLVNLALEDGLIDAAVLTKGPGDDGLPRGVVATTREEVIACAGSKFVGAHSLDALTEALDSGLQRIGIVALPCQVRSLRKMMMLDIKHENLKERIVVIIGLFCNWSFSARELGTFLATTIGDKQIRKFDIPPPPANIMIMETSEGTESIPLDEIRPLIQEACRHCPDMTSEFADVSVGMYEGRPGWNTAIVRTPRGEPLVKAARDRSVLLTELFPESNLAHLRRASINKRQRTADFAHADHD